MIKPNYWVYSAGVGVVWVVVLCVVAVTHRERLGLFLLVFGGWAIGWVSGTIARYVYPPPKKWLKSQS